jgi:hypothetical protein
MMAEEAMLEGGMNPMMGGGMMGGGGGIVGHIEGDIERHELRKEMRDGF